MESLEPHIDPYLFEQQLEAFKSFVKSESGTPFDSFKSNLYVDEQEGYKYKIYREAREALGFQAWKQSEVGSGEIAGAAIRAIEIPENNLVPWQGRFGEQARPHQALFEAKNEKGQLPKIEACLFKLYRENNDEESFSQLVDFFGKKYPLLAYFLFLKDCSRYLPIAPTFFDRAFKCLGVEFRTSHQCSWGNYSRFLALMGDIKILLAESLAVEVTLLDAHSFTWMLAAQMEDANKLADVQEYLNLSASEREAIVNARIGQGRFRHVLIDYWSGCAVTGCKESALLRASHIKPWAQASLTERLSLYNGLLLSPALDLCLDSGYISFDDDGKILISGRLAPSDAQALGIHAEMRLRRVTPQHQQYLAFHRTHRFK